MRKLRKLTESKQWQLWCAVIWSAMAAVWTRNFLQMRSLIEREIFSEYLGGQHLLEDGLLAGASFVLAIVFWRKWFLHGKKQNHQPDEEK